MFSSFSRKSLNKNISQNIISIDRSSPFNPGQFIGEGFTIEEENQESLALSEVDLNQILFETMLKAGETSMTIIGEENLKRLKEVGYILLDAKVFQTLWENQQLIPESWKEKGYIFFDGTILRSLDDCRHVRHVLYLYFKDGRWRWYYNWLGSLRFANYPSAVLAKPA